MHDSFWKTVKEKDPGKAVSPELPNDQKIQLSFMEAAINRINNCLCRIYTIENVLIEKGLISKEDLLNRINESRRLPQTNIGRAILKEMIQGEVPLKMTPKDTDNTEAISRIENMVNFDG
jgi:hypothetical protein